MTREDFPAAGCQCAIRVTDDVTRPGYLPTEREPRTATFLFFRGSPCIILKKQNEKETEEEMDGKERIESSLGGCGEEEEGGVYGTDGDHERGGSTSMYVLISCYEALLARHNAVAAYAYAYEIVPSGYPVRGKSL